VVHFTYKGIIRICQECTTSFSRSSTASLADGAPALFFRPSPCRVYRLVVPTASLSGLLDGFLFLPPHLVSRLSPCCSSHTLCPCYRILFWFEHVPCAEATQAFLTHRCSANALQQSITIYWPLVVRTASQPCGTRTTRIKVGTYSRLYGFSFLSSQVQ
jgi:hypothetical protein